MKVPTVFKILNNPMWMCKLKDKAKKKRCLCLIIGEVMTDKKKSVNRQLGKSCKAVYSLRSVYLNYSL